MVSKDGHVSLDKNNIVVRSKGDWGRIEEDLLGKREISNQYYYGIHTLRALENFQMSRGCMNDEPDFIRGMVQVKKAAALTNKQLKVLPSDVADAIVAACDAILDDGRCMDQFPTDSFQEGAGTSINTNTNEVIANLALEMLGYPKGAYDVIHPNDDVNKSQSTNDAYATGFRLGGVRPAGGAETSRRRPCR